jgi:regulator of protease activity HflC (stomatin/prohibitin superfamily)
MYLVFRLNLIVYYRRYSYYQIKTNIMIFIVLGILGLLFSFGIKSLPQLARYIPILRTGAILLLVIGFLTQCFIQVDAGQIGVKTLFGKIQGEHLASGLHFVNPLVEVTKLDVKTQNYTMSSVHDEGDKAGDDGIKVLTADGLEVLIDLTVLYKLMPIEAPRLLGAVGTDYKDKIVRPIARTRIRDNAVFYDAISLYSSKRDEFQDRIFKGIELDFKKRGLLLEDLLIRNISLPASVRSTIEQKISAEQEAQKMQFVLQKEKQEAERKRVEAQGISDYQRIINTGLTNNQLRYEQIKAMKEIATSQNSKVVIMGGDGNTPIILDGKQ